jgi:DNA-binding transcriptional LysR family regulator
MDLTQLRTFVAVAQEQHLTRAAERLHISQPTASAHIHSLSAQLRVVLFERTNRGLELTAAGRLLMDKAERVLEAVKAVSSLANELTGELAGTLSIGSNADPTISRIGALAATLRQNCPLVQLSIQLRSSAATLQSIRTGELDAGFLLGEATDSKLDYAVLGRLVYRIVGPRAWQEQILAADWITLAQLPWIGVPKGNSHHSMLGRLFSDKGIDVNKVAEVDNDVLIRSLIAEGIGLGLVRDDHAEAAEREGRVTISPLGHVETNLMFASPSDRRGDPLIRALRDALAAVWPNVQSAAS